MIRHLLVAAAAVTLLLPVSAPIAQDKAQAQSRQSIGDRDIYGSQMMTPEERAEYRDRMRAAKTLEERERVRAGHHAQMRERAKERGIALPEEPPSRGPAGMGGGMGPGGSMGRGR